MWYAAIMWQQDLVDDCRADKKPCWCSLLLQISFHSLLQWIDSDAVAGRENNVDNHRSGLQQETVDILYVAIDILQQID